MQDRGRLAPGEPAVAVTVRLDEERLVAVPLLPRDGFRHPGHRGGSGARMDLPFKLVDALPEVLGVTFRLHQLEPGRAGLFNLL